MKEIIENLVLYIKHKDILKKDILSLEVLENKIEVVTKIEKKDYILMDSLEVLKVKNKTFLVLNYSQKTIDSIHEKWSELIKEKKLNILIINGHKKIIINPALHHMISDYKTLKISIKTMMENAVILQF